jgi:TetR/AcrR family transcriptional regulator
MPLKPGERRLQILQVIASLLEDPSGPRITTALLAEKVGVTEAALYRHFASKAQMFEGLIEFIEQTVFGLLNRIVAEHPGGLDQVRATLPMLLRFAVTNPGMTRVLIGDALVLENPRLQGRINQLLDRVEMQLRQSLKFAVTEGALPPDTDTTAYANVLLAFVTGRWVQFAKSGFRRDPMEHAQAQVALLL